SDAESGIGSVFVQVDGGGWVVYTGPVTLMDGRHLVDYYAVNNAGLSEASHTVAILVDTVPPTTVISLSGTFGANGWYTSNVTVSLTATDATSGVANVSYRIDDGPWLAYAGPFALDEGSHVVDYFSSDVAGLVETKHSQSIAIDTTPPSTTASVSGTAGANGWYITTVVVSLSATDPVSGVSNVYSHVDNGPWQIYSGPVTIGDGVHVFEYYAVNGAGLVEGTYSLSLAVDTTPPASTISLFGTAGANGWYLSNVTGYLGASDATSGVANLSYQVDGGSWLSYNGPFVLGEGLHTVAYFASDQAGLVEAIHSTTAPIDRTPPSTAATITGTAGANGWYRSNVTGSLTGTDATSRVAAVNYRIDSGSWLVYAGPIVLGEGRHLLEYRASDVAGNLEAIHARSIAVDSSPPFSSVSLSGTQGANGWYVTGVSAMLTATDVT